MQATNALKSLRLSIGENHDDQFERAEHDVFNGVIERPISLEV